MNTLLVPDQHSEIDRAEFQPYRQPDIQVLLPHI